MVGKKDPPIRMSRPICRNMRRQAKQRRNSDLLHPHIVRAICHIRATKIITGPAANYAAVLDSELSL